MQKTNIIHKCKHLVESIQLQTRQARQFQVPLESSYFWNVACRARQKTRPWICTL